MTECGPLISYAPWNEFVLGSSGKILDIMEARIYKESPEAETGEIQVRGENVMVGYYKNPEATYLIVDLRIKQGDVECPLHTFLINERLNDVLVYFFDD